MTKNDERMTTARGFIVKLDPETMATDVYPFTERIKYTRTAERAAAYVAEKLMLDSNAMVKVTALEQDEYERRVYDSAEVFATASRHARVYEVAEDGTDEADQKDVEGCKRITVDVYTYSMVCMVQTYGGAYMALKVRAYNVTECRSGLAQIQFYMKDVLDGKRSGLITLYNTDGTATDYPAGSIAYDRVAAWDTESRYRRADKMACYLTPEQLAVIPFTVYRRGDGEDSDK